MKSQKTKIEENPLTISMAILNSVLSFVFIAYFLDSFYDSLFAQSAGMPFLIVMICLKVFLFAGIFGSLVELASAEHYLISFKRFVDNGKKYWKGIVLVLLAPFVIFFLLNISIPHISPLYLPVIIEHSQLLFFYLLALWIIKDKYKGFISQPALNQKKNWSICYVLVALYAIDLCFFYVTQIQIFNEGYLTNLFGFISRYVQFLTFIYLSVIILSRYPGIYDQFHTKKEIFLVNPVSGGVIQSFTFLGLNVYPPVFVVLKALTDKSYLFRDFNRIPWRKRFYQKDKLVAVTCFTSNSPEAYKIAKEFKKCGSTVVMGGPHVTFVPEEALEYCDSVVLGEVEGVWKDVMADYENGKLQKIYKGEAKEEYYDEVQEELLNSPPEVIKDFIEPTRGCKFRCQFCTIPALTDGKIRKKPIDQILKLIQKARQKYKCLAFLDNNIYNDPAFAKELFIALKPLDIKWISFSTIDIAKNDEVLALAKESGAKCLTIGYEIPGGSQEVQQRGKFAMAQKYLDYSNRIKKAGIQIKANFIFGFDSESYRHIWEVFSFAFRVKPFITNIGILTPLPGTKLYHDMIKENRLTNLNWRNYDCLKMVFKHKHMNEAVVSRLFFPFVSLAFFLATSRLGQIFFVSLAVLFIFSHYQNFSSSALF